MVETANRGSSGDGISQAVNGNCKGATQQQLKKPDKNFDQEAGLHEKADFEKAIELAGYGKFHYYLLAVCGFVSTSEEMDVISMSFILPSAQCDLKLNTQTKGWLNSIIFIGMMAGAYFWGSMADAIGRKKVLIVISFMNALCIIASSFSQNYEFFMLFRFLNGAALGGSGPVIWSYFAEFQPKQKRGSMLSFMAAFWTLGNLFVACLAWLVIPSRIGYYSPDFLYNSWRIFLLICALPSFLVGVFLIFFPESPKFLLMRCKNDEALRVFRHIYSANTGKHPESYPVEMVKVYVPNQKSYQHLIKIASNNFSDFAHSFAGPSLSGSPNDQSLRRDTWRTSLMEKQSSSARPASASNVNHLRPTVEQSHRVSDISVFLISIFGLLSPVADLLLRNDADKILKDEDASYVKGMLSDILENSKQLFRSPILRFTLISITINFTFHIGYYGLMMWFPELFNRFDEYNRIHPEQEASVCKVTEFVITSGSHSHEDLCDDSIESAVFMDSFITVAAAIPSNILAVLGMDHVGRKFFLVFSTFSAGLCAIGMYFVHNARDNLIVSAVFSGVISCGNAALDCLITEIFPTSLRATGVAISMVAARLGGIIGNIVIATLLDWYCPAPTFIVAALLIGGGLLCLSLPNTTREPLS